MTSFPQLLSLHWPKPLLFTVILRSHQWLVKNSTSVPQDIFGRLKSKTVPANIVSSMGTEGIAEEIFHGRTNDDRFELAVSVREVVFHFDCEDIPLSKNHLDFISDLETLGWLWEIVSNPQSPRLKEVKPQGPFSTFAYQDCNVDCTDFSQLKFLWSQGLATFLNVLWRARKEIEICVIRSEDTRAFRSLDYLLFDDKIHNCLLFFPIFNKTLFSIYSRKAQRL